MAAAAFFTRSIGVAVWRGATLRTMVVVIRVILSSSVLSRARNAGRGASPSIASIAGSEYSGMAALHAPPQRVERAKLQLLDGALAAAESLGGLANGALVDEPVDDDGPLVGGQRVDEAEEARTLVEPLDAGVHARVGHAIRIDDLAPRALRPIRERVDGDAQQPGAERRAAPF